MPTNRGKRAIKWSSLYVILGICLASCDQATSTLPIYGHREPVERNVDGKTVIDTIYQTIPDFNFINQDSATLTQAFFDDKIYVANFFFTHCPSICPTMQRNMLKIYQEYKGDDRIAFLSHSIDFKYDQPHILKAYATKLGVDNDQWQFVNGSKADIYGISEKYLVYTAEDTNAPGGYDHQGYLVLIDKDRRIRGAYDGTDDEQVSKLQADLKILLKEQNPGS
ncbi:SCO family protein [Sphingobacterium corticibacter]|uniref:SCO family protein n=1 Tax=Sphingobacterium corticibacter TaxID=2171749 RepID=A0A2T8HF39_9SPHI|nr:SCO family protein [Sphingobacterium corticibacter]PVH23982.1 SCO family protein [Sphingobacterium corticibacter]